MILCRLLGHDFMMWKAILGPHHIFQAVRGCRRCTHIQIYFPGDAPAPSESNPSGFEIIERSCAG